MNPKIKLQAVLSSTKKVVDFADHVHFNLVKLEAYADMIEPRTVESWLAHAPVDISKLSHNNLLSLIFVFSSLSFSYWGDNGIDDYFYNDNGIVHKTSWGLLVALFRAYEKGERILDFEHMQSISDAEFDRIINKDIEIPLSKKRAEILRYNSSILVEKFGGSLEKMLETHNYDVDELASVFVELFPSYRDISEYKGDQVYFLKKAQILTADLIRASKDFGKPVKHLESLTACADYRLPQLMRHAGIIEYSLELAKIVDSLTLIPSGSPLEIEIRAHAIWGNELIRQFLSKKFGKEFIAINTNDLLWTNAKAMSAAMKPYHRTRTIMY